MSGRLRVVMIEADGEATTSVLDAAMAIFGNRAAPLPAPAASAPQLLPRSESASSIRKPVKRPAKRVNGSQQVAAKPAASKASSSPPATSREPGPSGEMIERADISLDLTPDNESITYSGAVTEITAKQAKLAALLIKASPAPVDRNHLIVGMGFGGEFRDQQLSQATSDLNRAVGTIGLACLSVRGVGVQLKPAGA